MATFTASTPLFEVMRDPAGHEILARHVPELPANPLLHTLYHYQLGLILGTEESVRNDPAKKAEILAKIEALHPSPVPDRSVRHREPVADYEPASVEHGSARADFATETRKWQRYEIALQGPSHGNPFTDVDLAADFTSSGGTLTVPGFYDGEGTYRIRLLVPAEGEWSFTTSSNAASLDAITGRFTAEPAGPDVRGVVRVADTFHFAYEDGTPYLPVGTTSYAWTHQGEALEEQTLHTLEGGPFNKMRMCVFPKSYLFNENEPEIYPFEGSPEGGFDYNRPNPVYYRHLEKRIGQLDDLGIEADLILFHAYDRWGFSTMNAAADDLYVKYVTARLASHRNIWWSLANEFDLMFEKTIEDWERFAAIVQENDPNKHLLSIHNCREVYDHSRPWITHCSIQRLDIYKTAEMITEWRQEWRKPIVIDECAYEGNIDQGWGNITGEEMTRRFWEGAVRGGYVGHGETYVHPGDILWWAKGGKLRGTSPDRIGFLRRILKKSPEGHLEPLPGHWDAPSAGIKDEYELIYFGFNQPTYRRFVMPPGIRFQIDIIDTWNMTVETLPDTFEGRFRIELPGRQYIAVRLRAAA
ncbi:DUF5605 domain-containing protein [Arthrobacter sp. MMS18-M83]|uniref:DUF5605 domain-containing protein n=1 Tax=Arthrobacter sp. MMS18-M83 TaxID=2996261 RepID=UPI00227BAFE9|nr:DUF5605 domain-containing protein [Arthrobacter sp. MMS18-M83]WAH98534.1 DUF5605 domain-containing protein [Arthrobacter sp. MMS18-M83]